MLSIISDYDNDNGHIIISVMKGDITIISPTVIPGLPYLDRPNSTHLLGCDQAGLACFNGFIHSFEIHNVVLPTLDIGLKVPQIDINLSPCGPF
jgi:hypothetical protein